MGRSSGRSQPYQIRFGSFNAAFAGARLGYHTDAVLAETGFDRAEIASLRGRGVVA
jgi:crotonobetainyl-CoA:carnitine CoA-transferase CaiB-like acyl-CoA transferase